MGQHSDCRGQTGDVVVMNLCVCDTYGIIPFTERLCKGVLELPPESKAKSALLWSWGWRGLGDACSSCARAAPIPHQPAALGLYPHGPAGQAGTWICPCSTSQESKRVPFMSCQDFGYFSHSIQWQRLRYGVGLPALRVLWAL